jgi:hypothetical protein
VSNHRIGARNAVGWGGFRCYNNEESHVSEGSAKKAGNKENSSSKTGKISETSKQRSVLEKQGGQTAPKHAPVPPKSVALPKPPPAEKKSK